ncbi:NAD(P)-dependent oxidoreductase [Sphingomonas sp. GB1N7]|uniref:NAD(P)-dependent oxidoreductase n=1 Tax=Parasphingomonas caseinilytica TaxID=3096158 RepID=UPI002FCC9670
MVWTDTGTFARDGIPIDASEVDPDIFWVSHDLFSSNRLLGFFAIIGGGTRGRWVQSFAAGVDSPAMKMIVARGMTLTKSSAQAPAIAEYVMAHVLSLLHPIADQGAAQRAHEWRRVPFREVASTRWLLVGYGSIGQQIAARVKAFGVSLTVQRREGGDTPLADAVVTGTDLPRLLPNMDVVVLACALTDETKHMADTDFFAAMKPGSIFVNIGRGPLIDEDALRSALDRDRPAAAVLDVFKTEPLPADAWFWDHPKVRVTAHASSAGDGALARGDTLFLENLHRYLAGDEMLNAVQPHEVGL